MDFGLTSAFNNAVNRYGLSAALVGVTLLVLVFLVMKYALAKIEKDKAEHASKLRIAEIDATSRDQERKALLDEIAAARAQNQKIVENHLAHDSEERNAIIKTLAHAEAKDEGTVQALRELTQTIHDSRTQAAERAKTIHERLNKLEVDVATIPERVRASMRST